MYLCILTLVSLTSFGLGRLSVDIQSSNNSSILIKENEGNIEQANSSSKVAEAYVNNSNENKYVASKNGKLYYTYSCAGAKRIKTENQIWFKSASDAEKQGYKLSTSCK
jgi:methylphosphotriester-DNA--protein-cysteine methyltransferase